MVNPLRWSMVNFSTQSEIHRWCKLPGLYLECSKIHHLFFVNGQFRQLNGQFFYCYKTNLLRRSNICVAKIPARQLNSGGVLSFTGMLLRADSTPRACSS
jgi:hypothetical protein